MAEESPVTGRTIIACGGRDFADRALVFATLDSIHEITPISVLVHGAASAWVNGKRLGADFFAGEWAECRGVAVHEVPADWSRGRGAGPIRNLVVAFPGGAGTKDMTQAAKRWGREVLHVIGKATANNTATGVVSIAEARAALGLPAPQSQCERN
jgi:hypothetical protein